MVKGLICSKCDETDESKFAPSAVNNFKDRAAKGLKTWRPYCRACATEYQREYNQRPEVKARKAKAKAKKQRRAKSKPKESQNLLDLTEKTPANVKQGFENPSVLDRRELAELMRCFVDLARANARVQEVETRRINERLDSIERKISLLVDKVAQTHSLLTKHSERIRRIDRATRSEE
jgi:hypothetical protein